MISAARALPLAAVLLLGGCNDLFGPDVSGRLLGVDGELIFLIREVHGFDFDEEGDPQMALYLTTARTYGCRGHAIETDVEVGADAITVRVLGVREPDLCFSEREPATFRQLLDVGPGTWSLHFEAGARADEYTLVIDDAAIDVAGPVGALAVPAFRRFWRYPPMSFALGCDRAGGFVGICGELVDSVATTPGIDTLVFEAGGGIPYPVSFNDVQYSWEVTYYTYADTVAWADARIRAAMVRSRYTALRYYLLGWRNDHHGTWP